MAEKYVPRLKEYYEKEVVPGMMKIFNLKNRFEVPTFEKIVINVGLGEAKDNPKLLSSVIEELAMITGQRPVITRAKKSIAAFKVRKGMPVGVKVTLRGDRMWEFFDRLVNVALPRVRDFKGLSPDAFDKFYNYTIGIKEQIIFPEIDYDKIEKIHGMDIVIVLKRAKNLKLARTFLEMMGLPIRREEV